jgi:transposase
MLSFSGSLKIWVAVEPYDMRKGFEGLSALVRHKLAGDPKSGTLFVFGNRQHTRLKILYWDGSGLWVLSKRLEQGRFSWPKSGAGAHVSLRAEALAMLTDGVDLRGAKFKPWYERD